MEAHMSSIFVKVVDKTVSDKQLSVELTKIQPVKIEGKSAEQIVKNLETLLDKKDSLKITAGGRIFSNEMVLMEEIFDTFETQNINDMAYYYQIIQDSNEDYNFEIFCRSGESTEVKKL